VEKASVRLQTAIKAAGIDAGDVNHVGCYLTSLDEVDKARSLVATQFPRARLTFVQPLRGALQSGAACDAEARLSTPPREAVEFLSPPDLDGSAQSPAIAIIGPGRIVFSSAQLAFGTSDNDARLAFQRLGKSLEQVTASLDKTAVARVYSLSRTVGELARKVGAGFFDKSKPPAQTVMPFEGLPSMDASFAVDVIVLLPETK
jgi:enamine deaminase RidA (YjgF/YER057c/UK114 family)